jgi:uncharacterized phiE125 gp8 family phage protein
MPFLAVITPPAVSPVSLDEAKAHLRVDHGDDDALIQSLIDAATQHLDGPAGWLGRALIKQRLEMRLDFFIHWHRDCSSGEIALPCPPLLGNVAMIYVDAAGAEQTLDPSVYSIVGSGGRSTARLALAYGQSWPSPRYQREAVRIQFDAGYGEARAAVPAPIRQAILLHVGALYEQREAVTLSNTAAAAIVLPMAYEALLSPFRVFS